MTINPINQPHKITSNKSNISSSKVQPITSNKDEVSISKNAIKKTELNRYINIVKNSPDMREEKILESKKNLEKLFTSSGEIKDDVVETLVSKIIKALK